MNQGFFDDFPPDETTYKVVYSPRTDDWIVLEVKRYRIFQTVISHHKTELEAEFYAAKYQKESENE